MKQNQPLSGMLYQELPYASPEGYFSHFYEDRWSMLFESTMIHQEFGRYSYIAVWPFKTLSVKEGAVFVDDQPVEEKDFFGILQTFCRTYAQAHVESLPPFQGGIAGAFSYELYGYLDSISSWPQRDEMDFPDLAVGLFDLVMSFDHVLQKAWLVSTGWPERDDVLRQKRAQERLNAFLLKTISLQEKQKVIPLRVPPAGVSSHFSQESYQAAVAQVIEYIRAGDIFEANISQCFRSSLPAGFDGFGLYLKLRQTNPAPFAAYLNLGDHRVVSASPERFISANEREVEARPIKGTRRRSQHQREDQQLAQALLQSEKDRAENIMIVDLLRNDLSKVCEPHTVHVTQLCGLESYATVHHLVSVIQGRLKAEYDAIDLFKACFPGGSITGAPKLRAIEIISEIEPTRRGVYCGSLGWIGFNGRMDLSIAIRTFTLTDQQISFQAGGAVVFDSDPQEEYEETLLKSDVLKRTLTEG